MLDTIRAEGLNNKKFDTLLKERKKYIYKFNQLEVGMFYLVNEGHDSFMFQIKQIDYKLKKIYFVDLSLPDSSKNFGVTQESEEFPFLSSDYYLTLEDCETNTNFKFIPFDENQIFQLYNNTDFEENLILKLHVSSLKKIISILKTKTNNLTVDFNNKVYLNLETKKIQDLKNYVEELQKLLKENNIPFLNLIDKSRRKVYESAKTSEEKITRLNYQLKISLETTKKYKQLYSDLLGKL